MLRTISSTGRRSVPIFCFVSLCPASATGTVHQYDVLKANSSHMRMSDACPVL